MYSWSLRPGERVKKCASCSKDLPEAALHCVFCGAKQAAAPAVSPGLAKTAFGYSANEVMQQLGNQVPGAAPASQPYQPPPQQQPYQPPRSQPASQQPPMAGYGQVATADAQAKTMFVQGGPPGAQPQAPYQPPQQQYQQPAYQQPTLPFQQGYGAPPQGSQPMGGGMGIHSPPQPTPAPLPTVQPPPYLASQTASRAGRPIEPWKDSLRLMMFIWGAVALAAFAIPVVTEPSMGFQWDAIIHGAGKAMIPGLIWSAVGVLSIAVAAIPMMSFPRGLLAMVLGLAGIFVPVALAGDFDHWQHLVQIIGAVLIIPALFVRHEYSESLVARVFVTIGVVFTLVPYLIPDHGQIPLVLIVKALLEGKNHMEIVLIELAHIVIAVLCLLAWMPGPATAGAKIFAWILILFPIAELLLAVLGGRGGIGDAITKTPGMLMMWAPGVLYSVLVGYGGATVIGKQLE